MKPKQISKSGGRLRNLEKLPETMGEAVDANVGRTRSYRQHCLNLQCKRLLLYGLYRDNIGLLRGLELILR